MSTTTFDDGDHWAGRPVARNLGAIEPRCRVVATGTIVTAGTVAVGPNRAFCATLGDPTGSLVLVFLGRADVAGVSPGVRCTIEGTVRRAHGRLVVWNPWYRIEPAPDGTLEP